jgi:predicted dehydrogenase
MPKGNIKALLIGCGNIGAQCDLNDGSVRSHAKAFSLHPSITFDIYDQDIEKAKKIGEKYQCRMLDSLSDDDLKNYEIISLCTPTITHFEFLKIFISNKVPVVICEKPIATDVSQLETIEALYNAGTTKILVNYPRLYHPDFLALKSELKKLGSPIHVNINYQRGFMNNASHAWSLLAWFFNTPIVANNVIISRKSFDYFDDDSTISCSFSSGSTWFNFAAFHEVNFSIWQIDLVWTDRMIRISDGGKKINFFNCDNYSLIPEKELVNTYSDFMKPVVEASVSLLSEGRDDDFISILKETKQMIQICKL